MNGEALQRKGGRTHRDRDRRWQHQVSVRMVTLSVFSSPNRIRRTEPESSLIPEADPRKKAMNERGRGRERGEGGREGGRRWREKETASLRESLYFASFAAVLFFFFCEAALSMGMSQRRQPFLATREEEEEAERQHKQQPH